MENESWDYTENNSEENIKNPYINDQKKGFELIANLLSTPNEDEDFEQMIVFNSLCEDFFQLINDKQEDFAQEGQAYQEVLNIQTTVKNELLFPAFTTKQIIGLGGEFSSGKSSFLNSILKDDVLPTDINASTSIPTYICKNPNEKIIAYNNYGCSVELDRDALQAISHEFSDKYNLGFKHILQDIWICSKTLPYEYVKFLDTPGYSKGEFSKQDEQIALKSLRDCNALIWLIDCERGGLCETDIDFLDKISNRKTPLLIVVNKSDLKLKEEIISIKKNIEKTLTGKNFKSFTVVTYSTHNSDDFTTDFKTIDKFISRFNIPKNVLEPLLTRFLNITYAYKRHHTEQIEAHGEIIKCFNDQQLNAFFSNNGIIDKNKLHKTTQFFQTSCKFRAKFITEVEDLETKLKKCFYDLNECFLSNIEKNYIKNTSQKSENLYKNQKYTEFADFRDTENTELRQKLSELRQKLSKLIGKALMEKGGQHISIKILKSTIQTSSPSFLFLGLGLPKSTDIIAWETQDKQFVKKNQIIAKITNRHTFELSRQWQGEIISPADGTLFMIIKEGDEVYENQTVAVLSSFADFRNTENTELRQKLSELHQKLSELIGKASMNGRMSVDILKSILNSVAVSSLFADFKDTEITELRQKLSELCQKSSGVIEKEAGGNKQDNDGDEF